MKKAMIVLLLVAFAAAVFAAPVEEVVSFQGKIVEGGVPVDGTRNIHFYMYNVSTGGVSIWNELHAGVPVTAGLFNVELGAATTFTGAGVDFSEQYWIGISVAAGPEITPRFKLGASPYALNIADKIVKTVDQVFETDLHLDSPMGGDRTIWFGDGHYVGVGEYPLNDDDLLLYCPSDPVWVDAFDIRPTGTASDLGDASAEWRHLYLSGKIYADGASPANQFLGTDGSGDLTYLPGSGADNDWAYSSGSGLTGDIYHTGDVGVGTTSPDYELDINPSTGPAWIRTKSEDSFAGMIINRGTGSDNGYFQFRTAGGLSDWFAGQMGDDGWGISESSIGDGTFHIAPGGNVGIGTTSPAGKLHIKLSSSAYNAAFHMETSLATNEDWYIYMNGTDDLVFRNDASQYLNIQKNTGNVGIRTTTPDYPLHVEHTVGSHSLTASPTVFAQVASASDTMTAILAGQNGYQGVYGKTTQEWGYGGLFDATGGSCSGVCAYASGSGGINYGVYCSATGGTTNYGIYGSATSGTTNWGGYFIGDGYFSGDIGIGTTSPDAKLEVSDATLPEIRMTQLYGTSHTSKITYYKDATEKFCLGYDLWGAGTNLFSLYETDGSGAILNIYNGNVGIRTTTPTYDLQLAYNSAAKPSSSTWTIASDRRLKTDIEPFTDGLDAVLQINPVWYRYNGIAGMPTDTRNIGIIAQEIQEVCPYTVGAVDLVLDPNDHENPNPETGEFLDYDANALFYLTINAVKELNAKIEALEAEIETLKNSK